jgi:hypothetical protein
MGTLSPIRTACQAARPPASGRGGIRTLERFDPLTAFKAVAIDHSATLPEWELYEAATMAGTYKGCHYRFVVVCFNFPHFASFLSGKSLR